MNLSANEASIIPLPGPHAAHASGIGHDLIARSFLVITALIFTLSSGLLWDLGINYSGITGAMASKIHPATYLTVFAFTVLIVARRNPASFFVELVTRHPGRLAFLLATLILGAYIVLDGRRGIATIFDTYLLAVMLALIATELSERDFTRVEKLIHILLAANAALALIEYLIDYRMFPFRFEGLAFEWDKRSTALLGHPLENAQITGIYTMVLLAGGGASMPKAARPWAILLQLAALVPFGGRSALVLTIAMVGLWTIARVIRFLRGQRVSLLAFAAVAALGPMLILLLGLAAMTGFFDLLFERFVIDDGGSANSRLEMFGVLAQLSARDLLVGANSQFIDSMRNTTGLEWGIENPVVRLILYQGVIFTTFLIAGFVLFFIEIARQLRPGARMALVFFVIIINSYESISNKTLGLAQFVVLLLVMFHQPKLHHPANVRARRGTIGGLGSIENKRNVQSGDRLPA